MSAALSDPEDTVNDALQKRMLARRMPTNASYFAFTATPKNKTLEIFGTPEPASDGKLRSVERSNIGAAIRDFAQAAGQRDLRSFGFDDALDLIRKVSGRHCATGVCEAFDCPQRDRDQ